MTERAGRYPAEDETDVTLMDGSTAHLRPIRPEDDDAMIALFYRFGPHTVFLRFHHAVARMTKEEVRCYTHLDPSPPQPRRRRTREGH